MGLICNDMDNDTRYNLDRLMTQYNIKYADFIFEAKCIDKKSSFLNKIIYGIIDSFATIRLVYVDDIGVMYGDSILIDPTTIKKADLNEK